MGALDWFRIAAAFLVTAIHISPLENITVWGDLTLTRILGRVAVPFFFMATGYFVLDPERPDQLKKSIRKNLLWYLFAVALYLPVNWYAGRLIGLNAGYVSQELLVLGTFYHLWYFPAVITGLLLTWGLYRLAGLRISLGISAVLYLFGLLGDSYYGLIAGVPILKGMYEGLFAILENTRNGLFLAPLFLLLGAALRERGPGKPDSRQNAVGLAVSLALLIAEGVLVHMADWPHHDSMYLCLPAVMVFLFGLLSQLQTEEQPSLRRMSLWIYILHPAFIVAVRRFAKVVRAEELLVENRLVHYLCVAAATAVTAWLLAFLGDMIGERRRIRREEEEWDDALEREDREYEAGEDSFEEDEESYEEDEEFYEDDGESYEDGEDFYGDDTEPYEDYYEDDEKSYRDGEGSYRDEEDLYGTDEGSYEENGESCEDDRDPYENGYDTGEDAGGSYDWSRAIIAEAELSMAKGEKTIAMQTKKVSGISGEPGGRAWMEISRSALIHNLDELYRILPDESSIMAVVKADAYGHGAVMTASWLEEEGITDFAVATLWEGAELREGGIAGNILILGYTNPTDWPLVAEYDLIQTIVDEEYAVRMSRYGEEHESLRAHLAVDTGMHRLGVAGDDYAALQRILELPGIRLEGMFSHLCAADSREQADVEYTKQQIRQFELLRIGIGKLHSQSRQERKAVQEGDHGRLCFHLQNSYGFLNYPRLRYDYVRPGVILYGAYSDEKDRSAGGPDLEPVMSVRARVAMVKPVEAGMELGYGRAFRMKNSGMIATVTIGYADGIPRNYGENHSKVLIRGRRYPVVGRVCMDQFLVDVTASLNTPEGADGVVRAGDVVTLIGRDGQERILVEEMAGWCHTITNEILCRMGARLERVTEEDS